MRCSGTTVVPKSSSNQNLLSGTGLFRRGLLRFCGTSSEERAVPGHMAASPSLLDNPTVDNSGQLSDVLASRRKRIHRFHSSSALGPRLAHDWFHSVRAGHPWQRRLVSAPIDRCEKFVDAFIRGTAAGEITSARQRLHTLHFRKLFQGMGSNEISRTEQQLF